MAFASIASSSERARAGGLEIPDNGTEALGRGGAFVAKADDPSAVCHNVGGLAQQSGTRLLLNANVGSSSLAFQREGVYGGTSGDPATPWAGKPYPRAENKGGANVLPLVAVTSDLGMTESRVRFALGTFPPSALGNRVYPLVNDGMPSPVRYDQVGGLSNLILFHTAAVGVRVADGIDIGLAAHLVQANIALRMVSYIDRLPVCQQQPENAQCDARGEATTSGWSGTGSIGALVRPGGGLALGLNVRGPTYLQTQGDAALTPPPLLTQPIAPSPVAVKTQLPWVIRAGARKAFGRRPADPSADAFARSVLLETADIELDVTYEAWGSAMNPGPQVYLKQMGPLGYQEKTSQKFYKDTFGVRTGGSYTTTSFGVPLTLRAGAYYDSSATDPAYTRLDADTLAKVAATVGLGVRVGAVKIDAAYASVFSLSRTVTDGQIRSMPKDDAPAVNNGTFTGHTHVASLGATIELDVLAGSVRLPKVLPEADRIARAPAEDAAKHEHEASTQADVAAEEVAEAPVADERPSPRDPHVGSEWWEPSSPDASLATYVEPPPPRRSPARRPRLARR